MRILLVLNGNYYNKQDEFIKTNKLLKYTLDLNFFRNLAGSGKKTIENNEIKQFINVKNDDSLIKIIFEILEFRMQKGEFCVLNIYKWLGQIESLAKKYRYKIYLMNFNEPKTTNCLINPKLIKAYVPISKKILNKYPVITDLTQLYEIQNLSSYKKIHHIGDIHGCYDVLRSYLKNIKDDEFYIFLGDYIDRGLQSAKVLKFLLKLSQKPNICLIEGNHEKHLFKWANNEQSSSSEFNKNTVKDLKKENFTQKDALLFAKRLKECFFYKFNNKFILCSHGGVENIKHSIIFKQANEFINGVGNHEQGKEVAQLFLKNSKENIYQIFGHRNNKEMKIKLNKRVFLCETKIDKGGYLAVVTLDNQGFKWEKIKNKKLKSS